MIFALHDKKEKQRGAFQVTYDEAKKLNKEGFGIHQTVNEFEGSRKKENLKAIKYWIADFDEGDKLTQKKVINSLMLKPTIVVESRRGYHCYWMAKDGTADNYARIQKGINLKLGTDQACQDVARMLRMPGFYHMKDPKNPFLVKVVHTTGNVYSEKEMMYAFPLPKPKPRPMYHSPQNHDKKEMLNPDNWERIFRLSNIVDGCRNREMARITLWLKDEGFDGGTITNTVHAINERISKPLSEYEVNSILKGKV